jgi:hypothetical protein
MPLFERKPNQTPNQFENKIVRKYKGQDINSDLVDKSQYICEVWANNLDEEFKIIRRLVQYYNYVALDTGI